MMLPKISMDHNSPTNTEPRYATLGGMPSDLATAQEWREYIASLPRNGDMLLEHKRRIAEGRLAVLEGRRPPSRR